MFHMCVPSLDPINIPNSAHSLEQFYNEIGAFVGSLSSDFLEKSKE